MDQKDLVRSHFLSFVIKHVLVFFKQAFFKHNIFVSYLRLWLIVIALDAYIMSKLVPIPNSMVFVLNSAWDFADDWRKRTHKKKLFLFEQIFEHDNIVNYRVRRIQVKVLYYIIVVWWLSSQRKLNGRA